MAKKEKVELTPEELEAKKARKKEKRSIFGKTFKKAFAGMLAVVLAYAVTYIAFGKPAPTVQASGGVTQQSNNGNNISANTSATTPSGTGDTQTGGNTAQSGGDTAQGGASALAVSSKKEAAELINKLTAAVANGGAGYKYSMKTEYSGDGMKLDNAFVQKIADGFLGTLKTPTSVEKVVGGFIGIGEQAGTFTKGTAIGKDGDGNDLSDKATVKATTLTEADIASFSVSGNQLKVTLTDCQDPLRDDGTAISRATNNFINKQDVIEALANQTDVPGASLDEDYTTIAYNGAQGVATIEGDKLTSLEYSCTCQATVGVKISVADIKGTGTASRTISYSNFSY